MNFDNNRPIYLQIVEQIKIYIISGKIKPGDKILSVREYALKYKVNPNTIQKSLSELENLGLIYTDRTNGKFVTKDEKLINKLKNENAKEKTNIYINEMKKLGYNFESIIDYLNNYGGK